jgi:hypothetical protein
MSDSQNANVLQNANALQIGHEKLFAKSGPESFSCPTRKMRTFYKVPALAQENFAKQRRKSFGRPVCEHCKLDMRNLLFSELGTKKTFLRPICMASARKMQIRNKKPPPALCKTVARKLPISNLQISQVAHKKLRSAHNAKKKFLASNLHITQTGRAKLFCSFSEKPCKGLRQGCLFLVCKSCKLGARSFFEVPCAQAALRNFAQKALQSRDEKVPYVPICKSYKLEKRNLRRRLVVLGD